MEIKYPPSKKSKINKSNSNKQGLISAFYVADTRNRLDNENTSISKLLDFLIWSNASFHFLKISFPITKCKTIFEFTTDGSMYGLLTTLLSHRFEVYTSNIPANNICYGNKMPTTYPKYPFINTEMKIKLFIDKILNI